VNASHAAEIAQQARSVMARASSARVVWLDPEYAARHPDFVTAVVLDRPDGATPGHRSPAMVEVADPAPVSIRERIRARLRFFGDATLGAPSELRLRPVSVELEVDGTCTEIGPSDLWRASPDPLALAEAGLLGHLVAAHPEVVDELARLLPDDVRSNAVRVAPVTLDRRGLVLRAERAHGHQDVRLGFAEELTAPCQTRAAMAALLESAAGPRDHVPPRPRKRGGLLAALLSAGPAASRICSPRPTSEPPPTRRP